MARLVGLNLTSGVAHGREVTLAAGGTLEAADSFEGPCLVVFRPAAVSLFPAPGWPVGRATSGPGTIRGLEPHGDGVRVDIGDVWGPVPSASRRLLQITQALAALGTRPRRREVLRASVKASEIDVNPCGVKRAFWKRR